MSESDVKATTAWKIFAILNAVLVMSSIIWPGGRLSAVELASSAITAVAAVGLVLYAFSNTVLKPEFWRVFSSLFAAGSVIVIVGFVYSAHSRMISSLDQLVAGIGAIAVLAAVQYFTWLAVHRYGKGSLVNV